VRVTTAGAQRVPERGADGALRGWSRQRPKLRGISGGMQSRVCGATTGQRLTDQSVDGGAGGRNSNQRGAAAGNSPRESGPRLARGGDERSARSGVFLNG
jgi:hypothetical protein